MSYAGYRKALKALLPERVVIFVRATEHSILQFKRSFRNARLAFRPHEMFYHLRVGDFGGFVVAYRQGTIDEDEINQGFENDNILSLFKPENNKENPPHYNPAPDHVILDVGAHIGTFSLLAASKVPKGMVYAVEPSRETYDYLRINVHLNKFDNIRTSRLALSNTKGLVFLHHDDGNWGHTITSPVSTRGEEVSSDTLAGYMADNGIAAIDFIKFNCEGAEFPIILGTPLNVLKKIKAMLIMYHLDLVQGYTLGGLVHYLKEGGFSVEVLNQLGPRGWIVVHRD